MDWLRVSELPPVASGTSKIKPREGKMCTEAWSHCFKEELSVAMRGHTGERDGLRGDDQQPGKARDGHIQRP